MNERKTSSMLQRIPVILAVTAASYGLQLPPSTARNQQGISGTAALGQPMAGSSGRALEPVNRA